MANKTYNAVAGSMTKIRAEQIKDLPEDDPKARGFKTDDRLIKTLLLVALVGVVLAVQETYGLYQTWAYAWALVAPGGVGVGLTIYGLLARRGRSLAEVFGDPGHG